MRVRLAKQLSGVSDGVSLSRFKPGVVYDLAPDLAALLISHGAQPVGSSVPADDEPTLGEEELTGGITIIPPISRAADRRSPTRSRRK